MQIPTTINHHGKSSLSMRYKLQPPIQPREYDWKGWLEVYKGCLSNGQLAAIKRLTRGSQDEIIRDFLSELGIMAHVNHPNTVKLVGYGLEGGTHLVLELSEKGTLASMLYGPKEKLPWCIRHNIALGTTRGILYLHEGFQRRIIHRDIKATNILLTEDFEP